MIVKNITKLGGVDPEPITVFSAFDGMSCGAIGLDRAGVAVEKYYASEIDKWAIEVSNDNYPHIVRLGDILNWRSWKLDWGSVDLVIGGSPCQGFSSNGKHLAFDDPRSKLFFTFLDIYNHVKSLNPNVKLLLENVKMKSDHAEEISRLLGVSGVALNSKRWIPQSRPRVYWTNIPVPPPPKLGYKLVDVLLREVPDKYVIPPKWDLSLYNNNDVAKNYTALDPNTAVCMVSRQYGNWRGTLVSVVLQDNGRCLTAILLPEHLRPTGKKVYRKLTPVECERLQTVPDNYTKAVSNSQRYKMLGNGWTVDVITHILKGLAPSKVLG